MNEHVRPELPDQPEPQDVHIYACALFGVATQRVLQVCRDSDIAPAHAFMACATGVGVSLKTAIAMMARAGQGPQFQKDLLREIERVMTKYQPPGETKT